MENDLEVGAFLIVFRQLAEHTDVQTRALCAKAFVPVIKAATARRYVLAECPD